MGHAYTYRVMAQNFMGYGAYSSAFTFTPIDVPGKPPSPPQNIAASTTRNTIYIQYNALINNGGSPITQYNVYVNDGNDGPYSAAINNGLSLTYNTASITPALTTGLTYKFKYSGVNIAGEGPLSDEVAILMAVVPTAPTNF